MAMDKETRRRVGSKAQIIADTIFNMIDQAVPSWPGPLEKERAVAMKGDIVTYLRDAIEIAVEGRK